MSDQTIGRAWVDERAHKLETGSPGYLIRCAEDRGIPINDSTRISSLASRVALAEWEEREGVDLVAQGDDFNAMESGPGFTRDEIEQMAQKGHDEIIRRFVGAIGGQGWLVSTAPRCTTARTKALDAVLAGLGLGQLDAEEPPEEGSWAESDQLSWGEPLTVIDDFPPEEEEPLTPEESERIYRRLFGNGRGNLLVTGADEMKTDSARFIVSVILPRVMTHFLAKNAGYGDNHRKSEYGPRGELIGLDRKIRRLKRALWDGETLEFEQPEEMVYDIIGASFLLLDLLDGNGETAP